MKHWHQAWPMFNMSKLDSFGNKQANQHHPTPKAGSLEIHPHQVNSIVFVCHSINPNSLQFWTNYWKSAEKSKFFLNNWIPGDLLRVWSCHSSIQMHIQTPENVAPWWCQSGPWRPQLLKRVVKKNVKNICMYIRITVIMSEIQIRCMTVKCHWCYSKLM